MSIHYIHYSAMQPDKGHIFNVYINYINYAISSLAGISYNQSNRMFYILPYTRSSKGIMNCD